MQSVQKYTEVIRCSWTFSLLRFMLWNSEQHQKWDYLIRNGKGKKVWRKGRQSNRSLLPWANIMHVKVALWKKKSFCNATQHGILVTSFLDTRPLPWNNQPLRSSWKANSWCRCGKHDLVSKWPPQNPNKVQLKKKTNKKKRFWKHKPLKN